MNKNRQIVVSDQRPAVKAVQLMDGSASLQAAFGSTGDLPASIWLLDTVDVGLQTNRKLKRPFYQPGELVCQVYMIGTLKVWLFSFARWGTFKLAFGDEPPGPLYTYAELSPQEALDVLIEEVRTYVK